MVEDGRGDPVDAEDLLLLVERVALPGDRIEVGLERCAGT